MFVNKKNYKKKIESKTRSKFYGKRFAFFASGEQGPAQTVCAVLLGNPTPASAKHDGRKMFTIVARTDPRGPIAKLCCGKCMLDFFFDRVERMPTAYKRRKVVNGVQEYAEPRTSWQLWKMEVCILEVQRNCPIVGVDRIPD